MDFLLDRLAGTAGAEGQRGTERGYPDIEVTGGAFGGGFHAVDVKIAQWVGRKWRPSTSTQSRITLYAGNTYFRYQANRAAECAALAVRLLALLLLQRLGARLRGPA